MKSPQIIKFKDRLIAPPTIRPEFGGRFAKMECFKGIELGSGKVLEIAGTRHIVNHGFDNLITDLGMDYKGDGSSNWNRECQIGTGTVAEVVGDTALGARERAADSINDSWTTTQATAPYYGEQVMVFRFNPPGTNKVYSEVGISPFGIDTDNLNSRALIKDGVGAPDTISVLADEWLDVTYELRLYPDHLTVGNDTVDGYDLDLLAHLVTFSTPNGWGSSVASAAATLFGSTYSGDATLGPITGSPSSSGQDSNNAGGFADTYNDGTFNRNLHFTWGLNEGNYTGASPGIGAVALRTTLGLYQVLFDPPIPKTLNDTLQIDLNVAWARSVIP